MKITGAGRLQLLFDGIPIIIVWACVLKVDFIYRMAVTKRNLVLIETRTPFRILLIRQVLIID